ncbi:MAG: hypothetical protein Kow00124_26250 [Anaerolineae bacterium]
MAYVKTTDVVIRALEPDDIPALVRLCNAASMHVLADVQARVAAARGTDG